MHRYVNCIVHCSSEGQLLIGKERAALIDCGMAFCADETIRRVQNALSGRPLDYIFMTHTHYDHIGALPFFLKTWPNTLVVTSAVGAAILQKDTPRRVIREMSVIAAKNHGTEYNFAYNDDAFHANVTAKDGDTFPLGELTMEVLETPGHTRDSLSYFIPEQELLILSETPGVLMPDGTMYPCYLTSYSDTIRSIEKCRITPYKFLSLPHRGIAKEEDADGFFDKALAVNTECYNFILDMKAKQYDENTMFELFRQKYCSEILLTFQPKEAFIANARATISCTYSGASSTLANEK